MSFSISGNNATDKAGMATEKENIDSNESGSDSEFGFDEKAEKSLVRKIDRRLLPLLTVLYLLSFLDRTNIGNARLGGLEKDLGMKGLDYNIALAVFYPTYILAEIPSNMIMKKWRPSMWLPTIMVAWSIVTTLMGIVKNYHGLVAARVVLGLAEGGLFPGVAYYITMWYRRHECGYRIAIFFSAATGAGAFGGLLARGIMEMRGIAGLAGWSWLFIIEGLITFVVAIAAFFLLVDYPSTAKFLTAAEKQEVTRRLRKDHSGLAEEFDLKYVKQALSDWKIYVHMFITIGVYTCVYALSLFLPTIVRTLGYSNAQAQLMTVPPYIFACICCIALGWAGDKTATRGVWMIGCCLVAITGLLMMLLAHNPHVKYAGVFLFGGGVFPNVPQGAAWQGNNVGGSLKRGVAMAMHVGFGNFGGMIASFTFLPGDSPRFIKGLCILIALQAMSATLATIMTLYYRRTNASRDQQHKVPAQYTEAERDLERTKGDYATFFRYTF